MSVPTPVLTRAYDNARSCSNIQETILTPAKIIKQGLQRQFSCQMTGDARGCEAQPLIAPDIVGIDGIKRNLIIQANLYNTVWAFDFDTGDTIWMQTVGRPIPSNKQIDEWQINDYIGILSTPVIDWDTKILYGCMWHSPDGSYDKSAHYLFSLRLSDGASVHPPVSLEGINYDPGHGLPLQTFVSAHRKQRCSLALHNYIDADNNSHKIVLIGCGSIFESAASNRGWIIAVDLIDYSLTALSTTARNSGAGIWQGGQGLTVDQHGFIYAVTGNGGFDGITDFGESVIKVQYTPVSSKNKASLIVVDWFSPFSDAGRAGEDQSLINIDTVDSGGASNMNDYTDMDLGSAGAGLITAMNLIVAAGKDGIAYSLDSNNLGKTLPTDFKQPQINYAKAKDIVWFTYYNPDTPCPDKFTDLNILYANRTHHQHGTPANWFSTIHGQMLFNMGENGNLRAWNINAAGQLTYLACSEEYASMAAPVPPGGMPGGIVTCSCNKDLANTAIVAVLVPTLDANQKLSPGILMIFDAENFSKFPNGDAKINCIWRSDQWGLNFTFPKFNACVITGGKIIVPTFDNRLDVYNLVPTA